MPSWIDIATAAKRSGKSAGQIRKLCARRWAKDGLARLVPVVGTSKRVWSIWEAADAAFAPPPGTPEPKTDDSIAIGELNDAELDELARREQIVLDWLKVRKSLKTGRGVSRATARFIARQRSIGNAISQTSLYRHTAAYEKSGRAGLVDGRWNAIRDRDESRRRLDAIACRLPALKRDQLIQYGEYLLASLTLNAPKTRPSEGGSKVV